MWANKEYIANEDLVKGLRNNFHETFEWLFKEMKSGLYRFALTYTMNSFVAEDIVQDTFVRFWESAVTLPESTDIRRYLYSSVKNGCLNYYRHLQVEDSNKTKLTEALIFFGTVEYEDNEALLDKVRESLQVLPEQQRKVLELKIFQNKSYKEIAVELSVSEVTVHTHVKRAYKFIREFLPSLYIFLLWLGER